MAEQILAHFLRGGCGLCEAPRRSGGVTIGASVGRGGRNSVDDVKAIQSALNAKDASEGGPVLKLVVDGLAGPRTIATIEKYQTLQVGWADGRIDPGGPTMHALNGSSLAAPQRAAPNPAPLPKPTTKQNQDFIERVGALLPRARHWVQSAQLKIEMASDFVRRGPVQHGDPFPTLHDIGKPELALFNKYFHADKVSHSAQIHQLQLVRRVFDSMQTVLTGSLLEAPMFGWGVGHFQPDPADGTAATAGYDAYTFYGGWHQRRRDGRPRLSADDNYAGRGDLRQDTIFLVVSKMMSTTDNYVVGNIVHELAHFVGPGPKSGDRIADYTYESRADFLTVNNWTALRTAACYAYFAAEAALHRVTMPLT
jgi:hypothetical protein